jgi:hypothetical protein
MAQSLHGVIGVDRLALKLLDAHCQLTAWRRSAAAPDSLRPDLHRGD